MQTVNRMTTGIGLIMLVAAALLPFPRAIYAKGELSWVGRIETRPVSGFVGAWTVRGHQFTATSATLIKEELGPLSVGACAEVKYSSAGGVDTATRIERQIDAVCGGSGGGGGEQKAYAFIETIPPGNVGVWQIGGQSYTSTPSTLLRQEHGSFAVGICAEVEFTSASGSNTASTIATQEPYNCSNGTFLSSVVGTVGAFPAGLIGTWQIGGISYEATSSTSFQQRTPFAIGGCVKVAYFILNGVNIAQEIESESADDCTSAAPPAPTDLRKLYAPIETLPASPFVGAWRIGGVNFITTAATRFEQANIPFAVGACVEAQYVIDGSVNRLVEVESKPLARCQIGGVTALRAYGPIITFPVGLIGAWTVGGVSYQATASTQFEQRFGRFAMGAFVEIIYRVESGNRIATQIETHVAPGEGRLQTVGALESRPSDDTGTWVVSGVSFKGDDAIEIELEIQSIRAQVGPAAGTLRVLVNSYQASDGTPYATSIQAARQVFLAAVQR
jgi:hypothetical protein